MTHLSGSIIVSNNATPSVWGDDFTTGSKNLRAFDDIRDGIVHIHLWTALALQDLKLRYRGSVLGPFWITLSTGIMVIAMGGLYPVVFRMETSKYLPYLVVGLVAWQFISATVTDACLTFINQRLVIQQVRLPFSIHAYRIVWRNVLIMAHNAVLIVLVLVFNPAEYSFSEVASVVGALLVYCWLGVVVCLFFGLISARFRDVPPIVSSFLQIAFFVTPIFWSADSLGQSRAIVVLNPLFAIVDILRSPLIGQSSSPYSWLIALLTAAALTVVTFLMFAKFRGRIAYWV
jgi:ABC-type polysaccharide/polyol phosphate export permease